MYKYFLLIALILCSFSVSAQWQQTGSKVRYVNGLGIPTKDTAAGVLADSSQILIRPADSSLYVKYKRTWLRVGGGGGSIAGSGTTNYIPKFTSSSAIGNSQIFDNGTSVGIGTIPSSWRSGARAIQFGANGFGALWEQGSGAVDLSFASYESATNTFLYKTTGDLPTLYQQVTGNHAWYNALSGTAGNPITWSERMRITSGGDVGINSTSPDAKLRVAGTYNGTQAIFGFTDGRGLLIGTASNGTNEALSILNARGAGAGMLQFQTDGTDRVRIGNTGNVMINTTTDNGVDKLQVNGSMNVSTLATTNNLSVTTNATVGGTATIQGNTQINGLIGVNTTPSSYALTLRQSGTNIVQFGTQSTSNINTFYHSSSTIFGQIGNAAGALSGGSNNDMAVGAVGASNNLVLFSNSVERMRVTASGRLLANTTTDNTVDQLQVNGSILSTQYKLSALNTAPASATAAGTTGEIRIDANYIYICTATNTWKRVAIATW